MLIKHSKRPNRRTAMLIVLKYDCASPPALEPFAALTQHFLDLIDVALRLIGRYAPSLIPA